MQMEKELLQNVKNDMQGFQEHGTTYRKETSRMAYRLLRELLRRNPKEVFNLTKEQFEELTRHAFYPVDEYRVADVAKFLYVHKEQLLSEKRLATVYKEVDLMLQHN